VVGKKLILLVLLVLNFLLITFHSNFVWCRELYVEYHKKQVSKVDDARVTFELSTVLSKEVTHFHTCPLSGIEILD
jgi:hypothetical protein